MIGLCFQLNTACEIDVTTAERNVLESAATNKFAIANYVLLHSTSCTNPLNPCGYFHEPSYSTPCLTANEKLPVQARNAGRHVSEMIPHPNRYENLKTPITV